MQNTMSISTEHMQRVYCTSVDPRLILRFYFRVREAVKKINFLALPSSKTTACIGTQPKLGFRMMTFNLRETTW